MSVVKERRPRIESYYPMASLQLGPRTSVNETGGSKIFLRSPIPMDSNESLGRKPVKCNFLYRNEYHSSYDGEVDSDDATDEDAVTVTPDSWQKMPKEKTLGSFVRPKPVPSSRFSGFLRVLARSLHHCSVRIAAGFGLSRQPNAWYKHCWHTHGSQSRGMHRLGLKPKLRDVSVPLPVPLSVPSLVNPTREPSSTTL